jgi:hypothetical protein
MGALALGLGLLVERVSGLRLPGPLLFPLGLAGIVVVGQFATLTDATAELATPLVTALAIAGLALTRPWRERRVNGWALGGALAVFAVFAAPVVLTGEATFAGYIKLEDTATWLGLTDWVMEHGRSMSGLDPSSYEIVVRTYLKTTGYPVGSFLPLGVGRALVGQDVAWVFQPYLAFLAALLALGLYALIGDVIASRPLKALVAFVAAQPALLYGFSLQGSVKEMGVVALLPLVAALVARLFESPLTLRALLPLAVATSGVLGMLSVGGAVWVAPALLAALVATRRMAGDRVALRQAGAFLALTLVLSIPALVAAPDFLGPARDTLTSERLHGDLADPLHWTQVAGIWPAGDFRITPTDPGPAYVLVGLALGAAALGVAWAWRRRAWGLLLYALGTAVACLAVVVWGSLWADAKAFAIASPAFLVMSMVAAVAVAERRREVAVLAVAALAGGVLWSNALAYHDVDLAPSDRMHELAEVGDKVAGQGPTLTTEYEFYGARHFLRDAQPEGPLLLSRHKVPLQGGLPIQASSYVDVDDLDLKALSFYRTLVLRRSPTASRPPSPYNLVWSGRYYEVWQRPRDARLDILDHLSLKGDTGPGAVPSCADVRRLAGLAAGGRLETVARRRPIVLELSTARHPAGWQVNQQDPGVLKPNSSGDVEADISVPAAARYGVWLGGSFRSRLEVLLDGREIGSERHELNNTPGAYNPFGYVPLSDGTHHVEIRYSGPDVHPGSAGNEVLASGSWPPGLFALGPLVLSTETANRPIVHVEPAKARTLCGRSLDWIEAVG